MTFNAIDVIRNRPDMFIDPARDKSIAIAMQLIGTILHEGERQLEVQVFDDYLQIGTEHNWISEEYKKDGYSFEHLVPLKGIPNSVRGEVLLPALASWFSIVEDLKVEFASSGAPFEKTYLPTVKSPFAVVIGSK